MDIILCSQVTNFSLSWIQFLTKQNIRTLMYILNKNMPQKAVFSYNELLKNSHAFPGGTYAVQHCTLQYFQASPTFLLTETSCLPK